MPMTLTPEERAKKTWGRIFAAWLSGDWTQDRMRALVIKAIAEAEAAARAEQKEVDINHAFEVGRIFQSEDTHGDGVKCAEAIIAAIRGESKP